MSNWLGLPFRGVGYLSSSEVHRHARTDSEACQAKYPATGRVAQSGRAVRKTATINCEVMTVAVESDSSNLSTSILPMEHGQLSIDTIGNTLQVSLPNYPTPKNSQMEGANIVVQWEHPDGEIRDEPPVEKERDGDKELIFREDNGEICGLKIHNWDSHEDVSLMNFEDTEKPYIVLDPPRR